MTLIMKVLGARKKAGRHQILNTHEHRDHTGGNATGEKPAKILAHKMPYKIADTARGEAGDVVNVGKTVSSRRWTPGHTMSRACGRTPTSRHCSAAIRCLMPAPEFTMAVIRKSVAGRSTSSSPGCRHRH